MHRALLSPPTFHEGDAEEIRKATWLELFFDLVYVAAVIELGYVLTDNVTPMGVLSFILLFIPIWWSWVGTTLYSDRFDNDDLLHRILVFIQIFAVSSLAIQVYDGLGDTFVGFAVSYAVVRLILVIMYYRAYRAIPAARPLVRRYMIGFGSAAALWIVAALLPVPARFVVAGLAIVVDFYAPLSPRSRVLQAQLPPSPHHLAERFGLFTIIVLGELFLKVVRELAGTSSPLSSWIAGFSLFIVAISLWWLYFDNVAEGRIKWGSMSALTWLYTHFPLHVGLTMFGVGFAKVVEVHEGEILRDNYRALVFGAAALALLAIAILERTIYQQEGRSRAMSELIIRLVGVVVLVLLALFGGGLDVVIMAGIAAAVLVVEVVVSVYLHRQDAEEGGVSLAAEGE